MALLRLDRRNAPDQVHDILRPENNSIRLLSKVKSFLEPEIVFCTSCFYLGITAESLSRSIRGLREDGVRIDGARVTITDMARLVALAGPDPLIDDPEPEGLPPA